jgi:iron complex outermembrane receptor protein
MLSLPHKWSVGLQEMTKGKPLVGATITLKTKDSVVVKLNISDAGGRYAFSSIPAGLYFVTISHVGYLPANSAAFEVKEDGTATIPPISLTPVPHELKEAQVTGTKPLVEVKADMIVLNIENSINSIGEDVLDLLRKAPGVTVDNTNTLGINGKNGVQVYVDGRPTYSVRQRSGQLPEDHPVLFDRVYRDHHQSPLSNTRRQALPALSISG